MRSLLTVLLLFYALLIKHPHGTSGIYMINMSKNNKKSFYNFQQKAISIILPNCSVPSCKKVKIHYGKTCHLKWATSLWTYTKQINFLVWKAKDTWWCNLWTTLRFCPAVQYHFTFFFLQTTPQNHFTRLFQGIKAKNG